MLQSFKDKSSVMLVKAYVLNNYNVKAIQCEDCKSISEVLVTNFTNPNLLLYGCKDSKCKHRLMRLDFDGEVSVAKKTAVEN
jgi:hypothetical protein